MSVWSTRHAIGLGPSLWNESSRVHFGSLCLDSFNGMMIGSKYWKHSEKSHTRLSKQL